MPDDRLENAIAMVKKLNSVCNFIIGLWVLCAVLVIGAVGGVAIYKHNTEATRCGTATKGGGNG